MDTVLIAGAETWRTRTKVRAAGGKLHYTQQDESVPVPHGADDEFVLAGPVELRIQLDRPSYVYPMFEQALRISAGRPQTNTAVGSVNSGRVSALSPKATRTPGTAIRLPPRRLRSPARATG